MGADLLVRAPPDALPDVPPRPAPLAAAWVADGSGRLVLRWVALA